MLININVRDRNISGQISDESGGGGSNGSAYKRSSCGTGSGCNSSRWNRAEMPPWVWLESQGKRRQMARHDDTATGRDSGEQHWPLLRQIRTQHQQQARPLRQHRQSRRLLHVEQKKKHVSVTQRHRMNSMISWRSRLSQQQRLSRQLLHRRLQEEEKNQKGRCQREQKKKQEQQQHNWEAQSQAHQLEMEEEEQEEEGEEEEQQATAGVMLLQGGGGTVQQLHLQNGPFLRECCHVQGDSLSWPLHRQHELSRVQLMGTCIFREVAAHGQEGSGGEVHASHFRQRQTTAHPLPGLEGAEGGAATTGGEGEEGNAVTDEEEEADEEERPASFSMVLRPNVFASWRSRHGSSSEVGASMVLRSRTSIDSGTRGCTAIGRSDRSAEGKRHRADDTAAPVTNDIERAVAVDAVSAAGVGDSGRSFAAADADAGPQYKKSFASACFLWSKCIFCSRTRWHYLIFLCIYAYLIGPIYLNWAPLRELLFRSGAYAWECDPSERDPNSLTYISPNAGGSSGRGESPAACVLQRLRVGNLYTVCAAADFGFSFFGGLVVDWLGPKTGSLLGSTSMFAGWLLLALSCEAAPMYIPGMVLFGIGIDMAFYGTMTISRLFPGHANTVIAAVVGMRGLGLMSPVILNSLPLTFTAVMLGYALLGLLPAVLIASVYAPWKPFQVDILKGKNKSQQSAEALRATSGGSSSDLALDAAGRSSHRDPTGSPRVAAQETAADLLRTIEVVGQQPYSQTQQLLLQGHTEEDQLNHSRRQQRHQKAWQQEGVGLKRQDEGAQQRSGSVPAGSEKKLAAEKHDQKRRPGRAAEEKQRLLQPGAAAADEERGSHLNTIYGDDVEEGWLSDTGVTEQGRSRLFSHQLQLQQEKPRKGSPAGQIRLGGEDDALRRGSWQQDAGCSNKISSAFSRHESSTLPPLPYSRVQRPGELLCAGSSSSLASAQRAAGLCAAAAAVKNMSGAAGSIEGAVSSRVDNLNDSCVHVETDRGAAGGAEQAARVPAMLLQQQQQQHDEELKSTLAQQEAPPKGSIWMRADRNKGEEGQQGQPATLREDSGGSSKDKCVGPFVGGSRRTLSTGADEEGTEVCDTGNVKAGVARTLSAERWEHETVGVSSGEECGVAVGERTRACRGGAVAAAAAGSDRRGSGTTTAGWNLELGAMLNPINKSTGRALAGGGAEDQPNEAHAAALDQERQISLRRSLSSRQFPRTCAGRMRYFVVYVRQHPWTVQSVAFLRDYLFTLLYLPVVPYFTFSLMRSVYFSDASEDLVPAALGTLHVLLACVCVVPPLTGLLADLFSIIPCLVLVNTAGTLVVVGSLIAHLTHIVAFEYVAIISYMPFAAVMTNQVYFYVADAFPQKHLGKLCGFACSIGGVVSLSVTSMFEFSVKTKGGFTIMLCVMLAISILCYGLIGMLYIAQKRVKGRRAEAAAAAAAALDVAATAAPDAAAKPASAGAAGIATSFSKKGPPPAAAVLQQEEEQLARAPAAARVCPRGSKAGAEVDWVDATVQESPAV